MSRTRTEKTAGSSVGQLGSRLRAIREEQELTLREVAERSKLSISTLSKVESGKLSLSYRRLLDLSNGLDVDIRLLFEKPERSTAGGSDGGNASITARRSVARAGEGMELTSKNNDYRLLFEDILQKKLFATVMRVKARNLEEYGKLSYHDGEEIAFVIKGKVVLHTEHYAPITLTEGDAVFVDSTMGHGYTNPAAQEALVLTVTTASLNDILKERTDAASTPGNSEPGAAVTVLKSAAD